ncbi:MAG: heme ABC exporter ATP-binding protein CcmA [Chloroflexi bacterium]|nr:heme ABC exporter ATP-binding protein CcmA [Chloroflexota bacterium]MBI3762548.1 heme ABC exporter ATP-binding protein CcmA [Chloroflexota bacterium]
MIETHSLVKTFGLLRVLRGVELDIAEGEFVALLGPNGAGKTTLLRILATLSRPTLGRVRLAGHDLPARADAIRRRLGVVSHHPLLYGDLTAEENLRFYARMYGLTNAERRIAAVLEQVGLAKRRRDLVRTFSRGMQQRLAIARAILHEPEVMLFDEPHTGLDQDAAAMLDGVLRDVAATGRTVLMTTHDLRRALALAGRIAILSRGVIAFDKPKAQIEATRFAAEYDRAING